MKGKNDDAGKITEFSLNPSAVGTGTIMHSSPFSSPDKIFAAIMQRRTSENEEERVQSTVNHSNGYTLEYMSH